LASGALRARRARAAGRQRARGACWRAFCCGMWGCSRALTGVVCCCCALLRRAGFRNVADEQQRRQWGRDLPIILPVGAGTALQSLRGFLPSSSSLPLTSHHFPLPSSRVVRHSHARRSKTAAAFGNAHMSAPREGEAPHAMWESVGISSTASDAAAQHASPACELRATSSAEASWFYPLVRDMHRNGTPHFFQSHRSGEGGACLGGCSLNLPVPLLIHHCVSTPRKARLSVRRVRRVRRPARLTRHTRLRLVPRLASHAAERRRSNGGAHFSEWGGFETARCIVGLPRVVLRAPPLRG